jgi:LAGLIDADG endonuclease
LVISIEQNYYNLRLLYFIKSKLKCGQILVENNTNNAVYQIRHLKNIRSIIIPIFSENPLLTSKSYQYILFKNALNILDNKNISPENKDNLLQNLKNTKIPNNYISEI